MHPRQPLPRLWLMSDDRIGDLVAAVAALPRGSGIIFRHYATPAPARRALFEAVRKIARARRHVLLLAERPAVARAWRADGAHHRSLLQSQGIRTVAAHNVRERILAQRCRADLILVSPVYATRSHPGARPLGRLGFARVTGPMRSRAVALGGMNRREFRAMQALAPYGWAGIDAFRI